MANRKFVNVLGVEAIALLCLSSMAFAKPPPKPVDIGNTPLDTVVVNTPLPTANVDEPAYQPVQAEAFLIMFEPIGDASADAVITVPAGKRLVIESVLGRCFFGAPNEFHMVEVGTTMEGAEVRHVIPETPVLTNALVLAGGGLRLYADPETDVNVYVSRNFSQGDSTCRVSLSGHFVDLP